MVTRLLRGLERYLYRRAERIIILPPKATDYITGLGIDPQKVVWLPNGVNLSNYSGKQPSGSTNGQFTVMYMGAHGKANALDVLLEAAHAVQSRGYPAIKFAVIGDGPEKPRLVAYQRRLGLVNTRFRDPVSKSLVPDALQSADALVLILQDLALYQYGISLNKLFDYLAAGRPVILSGNPANNLVEEAKCGLSVPPGDPAALADAIIRLYEMPPGERAAMGQRGYAYVKQNHDFALLAQRLVHLLDEL
jgi:glycosyltransferase involved in cell wall biosynthesis